MPVSDSAISPAVRRQLEIRAAERGVPVDVLVVEILRAAVTQRATMSGQTKGRAARSPRADALVGRRFEVRGRVVVRRGDRADPDVALCGNGVDYWSAPHLAQVLNREERYRVQVVPRLRREVAERDAALARLGDVRNALRELVDAVCATRKPGFAALAAQRLAVAMVAAGRVLGDEPTFAPGGEEVGRG